MKIAAIITEYNPFHNGHEYQIKKTRELLGDDTAIIAIMSGNFVQRGGVALTDKLTRARAAVDCGINLVLELPFPYSMSSAEFFARAGVHIAEKLGIVDHLVFGSECGNIDTLKKTASNMSSKAFRTRLAEYTISSQNIGYPTLCELVYKELYGEELDTDFFSPNNILAIEYLKSLMAEKSTIIPTTIKRAGCAYDSALTSGTSLQSASAIRDLIYDNNNSAYNFVPNNAKTIYLDAASHDRFPTNPEGLDKAIISSFRLNPPKLRGKIHDAEGGLYNRLYSVSMTESTISSLIAKTETKKFTRARIRRAIWYSFLGVTSSDVRALPAYTQVLAMDSIGRTLLKRIKKMSDFPVITKPSSYKNVSEAVISQKELANRADAVFDLTLNCSNCGNEALTFTPYVKK